MSAPRAPWSPALCAVWAAVLAPPPAHGALEVVLEKGALAVRANGTALASTAQWLAVRDLAAGEEFVAVPVQALPEGRFAGAALGLKFTGRWRPLGEAAECRCEVSADPPRDRAVVVRVAVPLVAIGWTWWDDLGARRTIEAGKRYTHTLPWRDGHEPGAYPFCAVSGPRLGLSLAVPLHEPRLWRLAYDATRQALEVEFDLGLSPAAERLGCRADFRFLVYAHDPRWGLRDALRRYYEIFPRYTERRAPRGGIWLLGFAPETMACPWDFGLLFDEGGEGRAGYDCAHDVLPFVYTEPWGKYEHFGARPTPDHKPRYGEQAPVLPLDELKRLTLADLQAPPEQRDRHFGLRREVVQAIVHSAIERPDGSWIWRHWTDEWSPGDWLCNITLNPSPTLPEPSRASITWKYELEPAFAVARQAGGELAGVYLDSIAGFMGFSNDNFRRDHWRYAAVPLVASYTAKAPAQLHAFACYEFAQQVAERMRARGKLVMGNTFRPEMAWFCHLLDMIGAGETASCGLASDAHYWYVRTYAYRKPASWMDYSFVKADTPWEDKERGMQRCLFYAVHPGTGPFSNPTQYEPSRPLFRFYEPLITWLDEAGWEPVTEATSDRPEVLVERYGPGAGKYAELVFLALRNASKSEVQAQIICSPARLGLGASAQAAAGLQAWALVGDRPLALSPAGAPGWLRFSLALGPDRTEVVAIGPRAALGRLWLREAQAWAERVGKEARWLSAAKGALLRQGDFELGLTGWGTEQPPTARGAEINLDRQHPLAGKQSLHAVSYADNAFHALHQSVELRSGTYTLRFRYRWQRPQGAQGQVTPRFGVKGPDGNWVAEKYIYFRDLQPTGEAVAEYQREFSVPPEHLAGFFQFLFAGRWGEIWIDDVTVTSSGRAADQERLAGLERQARAWAADLAKLPERGEAFALAKAAAAQEPTYRCLRAEAQNLTDTHLRRCLLLPLDGFAEALGRAVEVLTGVTVHAPASPPFGDGPAGAPALLPCTIRAAQETVSGLTLACGAQSLASPALKPGQETKLELSLPRLPERGFGWTDVLVDAHFLWRGANLWLPRRTTLRLHPPLEVEAACPLSVLDETLRLVVRSWAGRAGRLQLLYQEQGGGPPLRFGPAAFALSGPGPVAVELPVPQELKSRLETLARQGGSLQLGWAAELPGVAPAEGQLTVPVVRGATCPRLATNPRCDGHLAPDEWQGAARLEGFCRALDGQPAPRPTTVLLAHDGASLFVAWLCGGQAEPTAAQRPRDGAVWEDDAVELFVQPPASSCYYHFVVNAAGQQYDARIESGTLDAAWSADWQAAVGRDADGWVVEMAVPWRVFGSGPMGLWRMNFGREEADTHIATCWAPTLGSFHSPERFGKVAL
jgi:hypothetical protein